MVLARPSTAQQTLSWSPTGVADAGGSGTWNTAGIVWANGACCQTWNNAASPRNNALFGGTAGTVTVSGTINLHSLSFTVGGYTLTGGTLALGDAGATITTSSTATTVRPCPDRLAWLPLAPVL